MNSTILDEMIDLGYFNEEAKRVKDMRTNMSYADSSKYFLDSLINTNFTQDVTRQISCAVIVAIHYFFAQAILKNADKTINTLKKYIVDDNGIGSYEEILVEKGLLDNKLRENKGKSLNIVQKKSFANDMLQTYSKFTEVGNRNLGNLISIIKIYDKINLNKDISKINLNTKIKVLNGYDKNLNGILNLIDRNLRNHIAHNNVKYNYEKDCFESITGGKLNISISQFILNIYPNIIALNRGYMGAIYLIILATQSKEEYLDYYEKIKKVTGGIL